MPRTQLLAAALAGVLLTACSPGSAPAGSPAPSSTPADQSERSTGAAGGAAYTSYVALGDSYTAGPYVPTTDLANGCLRSDGNYPSLVADRLEIAKFTDVSCSGADTRDLSAPQATFRSSTVPPQLDALTRQTELVTLGIGGNDFDLFGTLLQTCTRLRATDPRNSPCTEYFASQGTDLDTRIARIGDRVSDAVARVQEISPDARVLLVGYPRIAPETGTCPRRLPLAAGDYRTAERIARSLRDVLRAAAKESGVDFVDMYPPSLGHDVCSDDPWVNGQTTDQGAALAFHPFPAGMDAVADRIVALLR